MKVRVLQGTAPGRRRTPLEDAYDQFRLERQGNAYPRPVGRTAQRWKRCPGFDACFKAPKSVSLEAVREAMAYLEASAAKGRRGRNGAVQMGSTGFAVAREPRDGSARYRFGCDPGKPRQEAADRWAELRGG